MSTKETTISLANASADVRREEIRREMDHARAEMEVILSATHKTIENLLKTITPLAHSIASLTVEAKGTLTELSREARSSLNAVQITALELPTAHTKAVQRTVTNLEKRTTELFYRSLEIQKQATTVANFAVQIEQRQRQSNWRLAVTVGFVASLLPTLAILGLSEAARVGGPATLLAGLRQMVGL